MLRLLHISDFHDFSFFQAIENVEKGESTDNQLFYPFPTMQTFLLSMLYFNIFV